MLSSHKAEKGEQWLGGTQSSQQRWYYLLFNVRHWWWWDRATRGDCSVPIVIWLFHWLESVILHVFMRLCDIVNKKVSKCRVKREIGGHCGGVYCNVPPACTWEPASTCPGLQRAAAGITWGSSYLFKQVDKEIMHGEVFLNGQAKIAFWKLCTLYYEICKRADVTKTQVRLVVPCVSLAAARSGHSPKCLPALKLWREHFSWRLTPACTPTLGHWGRRDSALIDEEILI